jgi:lysozyme
MLDVVIDISHHNGLNLDFKAAAGSGIRGVIHKATQGLAGQDPRFADNKKAILAAKLLFGSYHFGDGSDGGAQAIHYLSVAKPAANELMALDFESNPGGPSMTLEEGRAFVTTTFNATGKWPVLYGGHTLKELLATGHVDPVLTNCPLWLAQYGPTAVLPLGWSSLSLWQYTDGSQPGSQPVPGIGHCDRSRFNGNDADLLAFWASVSPSTA